VLLLTTDGIEIATIILTQVASYIRGRKQREPWKYLMTEARWQNGKADTCPFAVMPFFTSFVIILPFDSLLTTMKLHTFVQ